MSNLLKRTISGTVFLAVMLAGLLINQWLFGILLTLIAVGMFYEYLRIPEKSRTHRIVGIIYILLGLVALNALAFLKGTWSGIPVLCVLIMIWGTDVGGYCIGSTIGKKDELMLSFDVHIMAPDKITFLSRYALFNAEIIECGYIQL